MAIKFLHKRILLSAALLGGIAAFCALPCRAESGRWSGLADTVFSYLGPADGLPTKDVTAIAEDGSGFLWVGTTGGVARWDGYHFKSYKPSSSDLQSIPDNYIQCLHADKTGQLWIGTNSGGLARYDAASDSFSSVSLQSTEITHLSIRTIADDGADGLWIATDGGLDHISLAGEMRRHLSHAATDPGSLSDDSVLALMRDHAGSLWVGTRRGLSRLVPESGKFSPIPLPTVGDKDIAVSAILEDASGRIWIGTTRHGVFVMDGKDSAPRALTPSEGLDLPVESLWVKSIQEVSPGEIWVGTHGEGIIAIDANTWRMRSIRHAATQRTSLSHDRVWNLYRDHAGLIWIGSTGGLDKYDPSQTGVSTVFRGVDKTGGSSESDVMSVLAAGDGRIWLGYANNGVDLIDPAGGKVSSLRPDPNKPEAALPRDYVTALHQLPAGEVFIGTARGFYRTSSDGRNVTRLVISSDRPDMWVRTVWSERQSLWIGSDEDGLWRYDLGKGAVTAHFGRETLTDTRIRAVLPDGQGNLWIGTRNGLNRFNLASGQVEQILPVKNDSGALSVAFASTLIFDDRGRLWVGTIGGGIHVMEGRDEAGRPRFRRIGTEHGLPNLNVDKLLRDKNGKIWASTDDGLAIIDPDTLSAKAFHQAEGSAISLYFIGSGGMTREGDLLFGGVGGLTVAHPDQLHSWAYLPPIAITDMRISGNRIPSGAFTDDHSSRPLIVDSEPRSLAVEFSALDFSAPERNRYAYRLDGFDEKWNDTDSTRRIAAYTNLPPGDYHLLLRGSNRDGAWTQTDFSLPIRVTPHWYETSWFKLATLALALSALTLLIQSRTRYLRARQKQLENQVEQRTSQLRQTTERISTLLDNSGEGFLSFGADLIIEEGCSRACAAMLGGLPAGRAADLALFAEEPRIAELFREAAAKAIAATDRGTAQLYLSLLPHELRRNGLTLRADYKRLENGHLMVVLTDVTEARRLAKTVEEEHRRQAMIVAAVTEGRDFFAALDSFRGFARTLKSGLGEGALPRDLFRQVHTYKGLLSQFHFQALPRGLHDLERLLADLSRGEETLNLKQIGRLIGSIDFDSLLEEDLAPLRNALGADFVERGSEVRLSAKQMAEFKSICANLLRHDLPEAARDELQGLNRRFARLGQSTLCDILSGFDRMIAQQSVSLDREVLPLKVDGGEEVWLDPDHWGPFLGTLVHVFRNAVAHGIELPEARRAAGKPVAGAIRCAVAVEDDGLRLSIEDDGAGIQPEILRAKVVSLGLMSAAQAESLSEAALLDLVFLDGLSTKEAADEISGRGVGLAAVRAEARALGGEVVVRSQPGRGTAFLFTLPLHYSVEAGAASGLGGIVA